MATVCDSEFRDFLKKLKEAVPSAMQIEDTTDPLFITFRMNGKEVAVNGCGTSPAIHWEATTHRYVESFAPNLPQGRLIQECTRDEYTPEALAKKIVQFLTCIEQQSS